MKNIIEYFNNNAFIASIVTLVLSVVLSAIMTKIINRTERKANKKDRLEEEKRKEKLNKAILRIEKEKYLEELNKISLVYDDYKKEQIATGKSKIVYNKNILNDKKNSMINIRLKNIGKSPITELYFVAYDSFTKILVEKSKLRDYIKNGWLSSVVGYYDTILPEECLSLDIYYCDDSITFTYGYSEVTVYYKDGYGNYYWQLLFLKDERIEEPHEISREKYIERTARFRK